MRLDDFDQAQARRARAMIYLGRRYPASPGYYRDAGMALAELKIDRPRELWLAILQEGVGVSARRAYQLLALAKGRSLAQLRQENAARVRKHRKSKWLYGKKRPWKAAKDG